jgi:hypothetical protein
MRSKYVKTKQPTVTYPLLDVMAYAVMAADINNGEYLKEIKRVYPNRNEAHGFLPELRDTAIKAYANKAIMTVAIPGATPKYMNKLTSEKRCKGTPQLEKYATSKPTAKQKKLAGEIISHYQGLMFKAIGGKINEFEQKVLDVVKRGEINTFEFGIVASLPKSYVRSVERDKVEREQRALSVDSKHIGRPKDKVELDVEILRVNFIASLNCHVVNAKDTAGNLIVFFTSKGSEFTDIKDMKVNARVKRHQVSTYHGGNETVLNYVKKIS